ncbi:MAG TPA: putative 2OG-Fe(II) oxygenase [Gammaproteobacteria bacterium]|nr:putative 2OG-Fe(II) oxygenase [Gammaproteobacteria bacterium]
MHLDRGELEEAEREYARAVALDPQDVAAQIGLAKLRYMCGDASFARDLVAAVAAHRSNGFLQVHFANMLRQIGDLAGAEVMLRDLIARQGPVPELQASLAAVLHSAGRLEEAVVEARAAAEARVDDSAVILNFVAVLLSLGRADEAMPRIRAQRAKTPFHPSWIAYEATAARLLDAPAYAELYDYARLVRVYDLPAPRGWSSTAEFNTALAADLAARHTLRQQPFDQTLRFGTQTMGDLARDANPIMQTALAAFDEAIADYRASVGQAADHPLTAQNVGTARYVGCWSVRLRQNGFHVNHLHPEGWLSSAYYVAVPAESADPAQQSGWLKFGEPALPVPGAGPAYSVKPQPGRLVLFPSYMWHGTTAIRGTETRLTMAFDITTNPRPPGRQ